MACHTRATVEDGAALESGSGGQSFVAMVKPADLRNRDHLAAVRRSDEASIRAIFVERQMRAGALVIVDIPGKDAAQMALVDHNYMVQALAANRTDDPVCGELLILGKSVIRHTQANLRILEVDEIKTIPCTPVSHPFVERLIGTVRREYLDRTLFWNRGDLERKLDNYKAYYNQHRCHTGLAGATPAERSGVPAQPIARLESYTWRQHCNGLFQTPAAA